MIRKGILLTAVVLLSAAGIVQAGPFESTRGDVGVTVGATYLSRYIWYGIDMFADDHSAIQPFASFDLWGTGWVFDTHWTRANGSGFENWEQLDYALSYGGTCNQDSRWATDWRVGGRYYNHPDGPIRHSDGCTQDIDRQEFFGTFSWPAIASCGVVPSYTLVFVKPDEGGRNSNGCSTASHNGNSYWREGAGFVHIFGLAKNVPLPGASKQNIRLSADAVFNDGMGGGGVDHDWSHVNWGVQTDIAVNDTTTFTPGIVYQTTMDKSVNTSDEWWFFLSLSHLCN
jgi:hypothetical protein